MEREIAELTARPGTVPPPWAAFPDTHPYSLLWRMGAGEAFVIVWRAWWEEQALGEPGRVAYFRRFLPPPRWLEWTLDALWELPEGEENDPDLGPYFARAEELGLGTRGAFEHDLARGRGGLTHLRFHRP